MLIGDDHHEDDEEPKAVSSLARGGWRSSSVLAGDAGHCRCVFVALAEGQPAPPVPSQSRFTPKSLTLLIATAASRAGTQLGCGIDGASGNLKHMSFRPPPHKPLGLAAPNACLCQAHGTANGGCAEENPRVKSFTAY